MDTLIKLPDKAFLDQEKSGFCGENACIDSFISCLLQCFMQSHAGGRSERLSLKQVNAAFLGLIFHTLANSVMSKGPEDCLTKLTLLSGPQRGWNCKQILLSEKQQTQILGETSCPYVLSNLMVLPSDRSGVNIFLPVLLPAEWDHLGTGYCRLAEHQLSLQNVPVSIFCYHQLIIQQQVSHKTSTQSSPALSSCCHSEESKPILTEQESDSILKQLPMLYTPSGPSLHQTHICFQHVYKQWEITRDCAAVKQIHSVTTCSWDSLHTISSGAQLQYLVPPSLPWNGKGGQTEHAAWQEIKQLPPFRYMR